MTHAAIASREVTRMPGDEVVYGYKIVVADADGHTLEGLRHDSEKAEALIRGLVPDEIPDDQELYSYQTHKEGPLDPTKGRLYIVANFILMEDKEIPDELKTGWGSNSSSSEGDGKIGGCVRCGRAVYEDDSYIESTAGDYYCSIVCYNEALNP